MLKLISSLVIFLAIANHHAFARKPNVIGYVGTWAHYRSDKGKFTVDDIDPNLFTHLIYSFVGINKDGTIKSLDSWLDIDLQNFRKFNNLKQKNPELKTLVAIGGWNQGSENFSAVASSAASRKEFAKKAKEFCNNHNFDGIDMDWEYPGQRGGKTEDKKNFVLMLEELNNELKQDDLLLTAAVAAGEASAAISYNITEMSKHVDYINLMEYDFHGSWEKTAEHHAALHSKSPHDKLNVESSVKYWLNAGAPAAKLNLGLGLYGRTFKLSNTNQKSLGASATGPGTKGKYTMEDGFLGYNEICEKLKNKEMTEMWDATAKVPYATGGNDWVGYDNADSITAKGQFIKDNKLAGGMFWSIETDDFRGTCGKKYPLVTALKNCLGGNSAGETTKPTTRKPDVTIAPSTAGTAKPTAVTVKTTGSPGSIDCVSDGLYRHNSDCSKFYQCSSGRKFELTCPPGLHFNAKISVCDFKEKIVC
ncbi:chitinase-3-like protein 1 [Toxorhynchites rutilus septentrionalis]|uniref:chitinase-3-like protein 1 n=1 Tax=Toxorhynchites rutilus septentrionalis TaxID=329112 RepID=UPI00247923DB|nr:chitinase-3-like protein 1 [Toxorhynchites rutilus septentrionalis]